MKVLGTRDVQVSGHAVEVVVHLPTPEVGDDETVGFICDAHLRGWGGTSEVVEITAGGVDVIDALLMCLAAVGTRIDVDDPGADWLGLGTAGFPIIDISGEAPALKMTLPQEAEAK